MHVVNRKKGVATKGGKTGRGRQQGITNIMARINAGENTHDRRVMQTK